MVEKVEAVDLPSADFLPSANVSKAPSVAPAVAVEAPSGGSRTAMTIGLAVAALALIGAVVYFTMLDRKSSNKGSDPAKVDVGSEQQDYDMKQPQSSLSTVPSETPAAPKPPAPRPPPVVVPKTIPKPPGPQPKRKKPEDIYDGL